MIFSGKCVSMMHGYSVTVFREIHGHEFCCSIKNNTGTLYLSSFNHEHAPECPMYRQLSGNEEETSLQQARISLVPRINYRNFLPPDDSISVIRLGPCSAYHKVSAPPFARKSAPLPFTPVAY